MFSQKRDQKKIRKFGHTSKSLGYTFSKNHNTVAVGGHPHPARCSGVLENQFCNEIFLVVSRGW